MKAILIISMIFLFWGCSNAQMNNGITWGTGSFDSNGERIYFTATSERGTPITYTGGPPMGMMMMGGHYACVSCHGTDARGGRHMMHMDIMDAPNIRWPALIKMQEEEEGHAEGNSQEDHVYDFADFKKSVEKGQHPDGDKLSTDMPRWRMSDADLRDLMNYLKTLK